jgi:hypothetical protein
MLGFNRTVLRDPVAWNAAASSSTDPHSRGKRSKAFDRLFARAIEALDEQLPERLVTA